MATRFKSSRSDSNSYISEQEESDIAQENLVTSTSSPTKRRGIQKRVVQIPIKEIEGCRLKGESNTPPSDSWAWRKYGQKPIKGSPYPRGYYRCSSSKGCPARKQVERSRVDPTMLIVTYSSDHNHPYPASRNHHHKSLPKPEPEVIAAGKDLEPEAEPEPEPVSEEKFADLTDGSLMTTTAEDELGWFGEMDGTATTSSAMLESPILRGDDADVVSKFLPMKGEDEWLFADLGELPECSVVFRGGVLEAQEEGRRCAAAASWCGTRSWGG